MNKILPNLLIIFALGLCGLSAFQWNRETRLHADRQTLQDKLTARDENIQSLQATIKRIESDVARLETVKTELTDTVKSNRLEIDGLKKNLYRTEKEGDALREQITAYKTAVEKQNESLKRQNEIITELNGRMKELAEERNGFVEKYNKLAKDYNQVVKEYNELAEKITNALPAQGSAPANPPGNKSPGK
jgi:chromosome segregation ATPase